MLLNDDCLKALKSIVENSVDSVVTDPPYGWRFMGKAWDGDDIIKQSKNADGRRGPKQMSDGRVRQPRDLPAESAGTYDLSLSANQSFQKFSEDWAKEVYRVLKPGGHMLVFCGPRTYHRMASGVEDAGFEVRDQIQWLFGSGFPKSLDISKAIDKEAGARREVVPRVRVDGKGTGHIYSNGLTMQLGPDISLTTSPSGVTAEAIKWQGWGTGLKPANEPILLARKPLSEKTVAKNVLKHGTGGLNIDGSRIATSEIKLNDSEFKAGFFKDSGGIGERWSGNGTNNTQGRFPANLVLSGAAPELLGECARFFYCAKVSPSERGDTNNHPTVKPQKLMQYLIKLITPPGGTVLDPFMGSGSTCLAAKTLGFDFIGIEKEKEYFEIAERRIESILL